MLHEVIPLYWSNREQISFPQNESAFGEARRSFPLQWVCQIRLTQGMSVLFINLYSYISGVGHHFGFQGLEYPNLFCPWAYVLFSRLPKAEHVFPNLPFLPIDNVSYLCQYICPGTLFLVSTGTNLHDFFLSILDSVLVLTFFQKWNWNFSDLSASKICTSPLFIVY
jgi:hypothetical protein